MQTTAVNASEKARITTDDPSVMFSLVTFHEMSQQREAIMMQRPERGVCVSTFIRPFSHCALCHA